MNDNNSATEKATAGTDQTQAVARIGLKEFFENVPPGMAKMAEGVVQVQHFSPPKYRLDLPAIDLHCHICEGTRIFQASHQDGEIREGGYKYSVQVRYQCRNCARALKIYALLVFSNSDGWAIYKLGELPEFGPPTPSRLITLIRDERDYYAKGRRSENQGLGIAAFAYYRRVVENQKKRIFAEIIRASRKVGAQESMIGELEEAARETQFSKAIEIIKPGVPQALLIDGHNPLTLLHNALSEGLHAQTDEDCLALATSIRVVLTELVERMASVLSDHAELKTAVNRLIAIKTKESNR